MKELVTRSISGIIYVAIIVGAILGGTYWFYALCLLLSVIGMLEFWQATSHNINDTPFSSRLRLLDIFASICVVSSASTLPYTDIICPTAILLWLLARFILTMYDSRPEALKALGMSLLSIMYIPVPLMALLVIYTWNTYVVNFVLFIFIFIWINDIGAYCFGSVLGKRRLFERLSPKKSWEGFYGGLLCCVASAILFNFFTDIPFKMWQWVILSVIVSVFATFGDLFESLIKRNAGIKDSGQLIPGHGGILDRIDSLLFVVPATIAFIILAI